MRYGGRVIALLIISALMIGRPALAGEMDRVLPYSCVIEWLRQEWENAALSCDQAAYDVLHGQDGTVDKIALVDGEAPGPGAPGIDMAYPAAFALARSAYAYYALGSYTKAEAQRQRAITLLSNAHALLGSPQFYEDSAEALLADLKSNAFFQNRDILDGPPQL